MKTNHLYLPLCIELEGIQVLDIFSGSPDLIRKRLFFLYHFFSESQANRFGPVNPVN